MSFSSPLIPYLYIFFNDATNSGARCAKNTNNPPSLFNGLFCNLWINSIAWFALKIGFKSAIKLTFVFSISANISDVVRVSGILLLDGKAPVAL